MPDRAILALSLSTVALGLLQVVLEAAVISAFRYELSHHSTVYPPPHWHPSPATVIRPLNLVPQKLATEETRLIIACGLLSTLAGVISCLAPRSAQRSRLSSMLAVLSTSAVAVTLFASFIYVLVEEYVLSSSFRYTDFYSRGQRFTRESWVCQLKDLYTRDDVVDWGWACWGARAGRWLFVPLIGTLISIAWMSYTSMGKTVSHVRRWSLLKQPRRTTDRESLEMMSGVHSINGIASR